MGKLRPGFVVDFSKSPELLIPRPAVKQPADVVNFELTPEILKDKRVGVPEDWEATADAALAAEGDDSGEEG